MNSNYHIFKEIAEGLDLAALHQIADHADRHEDFAADPTQPEGEAKGALRDLSNAIDRVIQLAEGTAQFLIAFDTPSGPRFYMDDNFGGMWTDSEETALRFASRHAAQTKLESLFNWRPTAYLVHEIEATNGEKSHRALAAGEPI